MELYYPNRITARFCKPAAIRDYRINAFRGPRIDDFILTHERYTPGVLVFSGNFTGQETSCGLAIGLVNSRIKGIGDGMNMKGKKVDIIFCGAIVGQIRKNQKGVIE